MKYNIYKCTSSYQKKFLMDNGLDFIWVDRDIFRTTFWLFEKTDAFNEIIKKYKNINYL